jgi:hypothetical protein
MFVGRGFSRDIKGLVLRGFSRWQAEEYIAAPIL